MGGWGAPGAADDVALEEVALAGEAFDVSADTAEFVFDDQGFGDGGGEFKEVEQTNLSRL